VEHVIREIREIEKYKRLPGPLKIMFADDNIIANPAYAKRLFRALIPLQLRWTSQASINIAEDDALLELAQQSGCDALLLGLESISQNSLNSVNKGKVNRVDSFKKSIEKIHAKGINIYSYIIFGFDDNEPSIFDETLEFVQEMALEFPLFNILSPIPGTRLYQRLAEEKRLLPASWEELNGYSVFFQPKMMSREQLKAGFLRSITQAYSAEAIFSRLEKSYAMGAAKSPRRDYLSRVAVSLILAKEMLGQDREMNRFIFRLLQQLWRKRDIKIHTLLMLLDRFHFARKLQRVGTLSEMPAECSLVATTTEATGILKYIL
jgi:radical SAM superfamily enzyme YgiQ (UPF0313 family)